VVERCQPRGSFFKHAASGAKNCSLNVSAYFALSQIMPLGQLGDTHPCGDAFDCELDTLQHSSLALIALHDFSPNFGEFLFGSDYHRISNWCSQESSAPSCLSWWRERKVSKMSVREVRLTLPSLELPTSREHAVNHGSVPERFRSDQGRNASNDPWQSYPHKTSVTASKSVLSQRRQFERWTEEAKGRRTNLYG
jgi:hypothetical protein